MSMHAMNFTAGQFHETVDNVDAREVMSVTGEMTATLH